MEGGKNMAYVPVPKDLTKVKTKVLFNLTKRQLVCFGAGIAIGLPIFFLTKNALGTSMAAMLMIIIMLPCFLLALYEKHGQPLEKVLKNIIDVCFLRPKERPYMTNNFYDCLRRQDELEKEVYNIVHKKSEPRGQKSHRHGNPQGKKRG